MTYDQWKSHNPADEYLGPDEESDPVTELDQAYDDLATAKQDLKDAEGTIVLLRMQLEAATEWARAYEGAHGPFKDKPSIPDFMVVF